VVSDLKRIRRAPALLIVVSAAALAFLALTALGSGHNAKTAKPSPAGTAAAKPVSAGQEHARTCDLGNGVTVQTSNGASCPGASANPTASPKPASSTKPAASAVPARPATPAKSAPAVTPTPAKAASAGLTRLVGARIMTAMAGTTPSASLLARARAGQIGGVILFGANITPQLPATIKALQSAAHAGGNPTLVISTDQEGGEIRRIASAPPAAPPAQMTPASAHGQGVATAHALLSRGINTDLAPVADVLGPGGFLGSRSFGSSPARVAAGACDFARGLQAGGVNSTFKHFPGLGRAVQNTDIHAVRINASASALGGDLAAYSTCAPPLVMLSNAVYPAYDPGTPAVLSSKIIQGLLRGHFHYQGVTISDTLSAPGVAGPTTAIRAAQAGVDILLYTDETVSARAYDELLGAARAGQISRGALKISAARIHRLAHER
jgi:beta-N-acetylhexosaminidase